MEFSISLSLKPPSTASAIAPYDFRRCVGSEQMVQVINPVGTRTDRLLRAWLETNSTDIQHFIASRLPDDPSDWTVRDAVAVAPESGGWVDVSRVPGGLLELHASDGGGSECLRAQAVAGCPAAVV